MVHKAVEDRVVEEHLGDDAVRPRIDLAFQVEDVRLRVRSLEMLLRVAADTDAEAFAAVHLPDGADELVGMGISAGDGIEALFAGKRIAPEGHHIVDAQEMEVLYEPFDLGGGVPGADDVGDDFHVVSALDAAANGDGGDAAPDDLAEEGPVTLRGEADLVAVGRDVDVAGLELHQGSDALQEFVLDDAALGRDDFQGRERMAGIQEIGDSHSRWDRKARASSGEKPRADLYRSYCSRPMWRISG